jgi:hypothetical protein
MADEEPDVKRPCAAGASGPEAAQPTGTKRKRSTRSAGAEERAVKRRDTFGSSDPEVVRIVGTKCRSKVDATGLAYKDGHYELETRSQLRDAWCETHGGTKASPNPIDDFLWSFPAGSFATLEELVDAYAAAPPRPRKVPVATLRSGELELRGTVVSKKGWCRKHGGVWDKAMQYWRFPVVAAPPPAAPGTLKGFPTPEALVEAYKAAPYDDDNPYAGIRAHAKREKAHEQWRELFRKQCQENEEACQAWKASLTGTLEVVGFEGRWHHHVYGYATGPTREAVAAKTPRDLYFDEPDIFERGDGWVNVFYGTTYCD